MIIGLPIDTPRAAPCRRRGQGSALDAGDRRDQQRSVRAADPRVGGGALDVVFEFEDGPSSFPDWTFEPTGGPHERPSLELVKLIRDIAPPMLDLAQRVERIVRHVEERFTYGLRDVGLGDDADAMRRWLAIPISAPASTPTATPSLPCVPRYRCSLHQRHLLPRGRERHDAPGLLVRRRCERRAAPLGHLAFPEVRARAVRPAYNPKPGTRYALSVGRDLTFEGRDGQVLCSRLSGFHVLSGSAREQSSNEGRTAHGCLRCRLNPITVTGLQAATLTRSKPRHRDSHEPQDR